MPTSIPPPDSHYITLAQFELMKNAYSTNKETILADPYKGKNILCTSELFNIEAVKVLSAVVGCKGMRIYYGMDDGLLVHAMMVAVDSNGIDILPDSGATFANGTTLAGGGVALEEGKRCPPDCP
jgi:hypothetical protein